MEQSKFLPNLTLFRFASRSDKLLLSLASAVAVLGGVVIPLLLLSLGDLHDSLVKLGVEKEGGLCPEKFAWDPSTVELASREYGVNLTALRWKDVRTFFEFVQRKLNRTIVQDDGLPVHYPKEMMDLIRDPFLKESGAICLRMTWLAMLQFFALYAATALAGIAAARQSFRIRSAFLRSLLHQDIAWFDAQQQENFAVRIINSLDCIQDGLGERVTLSVLYFSTCVSCMFTAFAKGWKLSLTILALMPLVGLTAGIISKCQVTYTRKELKAYSKAGTMAEESFSGIRTVMAFGGKDRELDRYFRGLCGAHRWGIRLVLCLGIGYGICWLLSFCSFGTGLWYGTRMVLETRCGDQSFLSDNLIVVVLSTLNAGLSLAQLADNLEIFASAKAAAIKIYKIIDRIPDINSRSGTGHQLNNMNGLIVFKNVSFQYPLRQEVPILQNLCFEARPGETVALVGASGCGKSTVIQLIQRFYDPIHGEVQIDHHNIKDLNVGWLRSQIGLVGQEPELFETTISENISLGDPASGDIAIIQAAMAANAHEFIMKLPKQYKTLVGEKGAQLSGGQKQRIAIARALVRNPKILLLDEATSALDSVSESTVQAALDHARKGRTTLVIAHRLSTIRNADRIVVIKNGQVAEIGKHSELMAKEALYYQLVISQGSMSKFKLRDEESTIRLERGEPPDLIQNGHEMVHGKVLGIQRRKSIRDTIMSILPIEGVKQKRREAMRSSRLLLFKLCFPEWWLILLGSIGSVVLGMSFPEFAMIFGDNIRVLFIQTVESAYREANRNCFVLYGVGVAAALSACLQSFMFGIAGERQTIRLRKAVFKAMLSQEASWYDDPKNGTGNLCARLSSDATNVRLATVDRIRSITQAASTLLFCLYRIFGIHFRLALVAMSFLPVMIISTILNTRVFGTHHLTERLAEEGASKISVEAIRSIRTVASLHRQDTFIDKVITAIKKPYDSMPRACHLKGLSYGVSQSCMAWACVVVLYYGSYKIMDAEINFHDLFVVVQGVIVFSLVLVNALTKATDLTKAKHSAKRIGELLDRESALQCPAPGIKTGSIKGNIEFRNVQFAYPMRPESWVLRGFDLSVKAGHTVALVGSSGCGKSTCIALLERLYDTKRGEILIDGISIKDYEVGFLRSQMGLVSQEPVLFGISVAENIAYGGSKKTSVDDVIEAARTSNIHNFICSLPKGYQTRVGSRESRLSGGEKQRVAIARALVRNPRILLLDEATSALDTESEMLVQEALDKARQGRTCIVIAHRLSTIQNADQIVVLHEGAVVESGKHYDLISKKGFYYKMHKMQEASL